MEKRIMTKKEAVELFGSEKCKKHFAKYGKFTNEDIQISLINEIKRYYDSVEIIKPEKSRSYVYELSGKKDVITAKEDGRIANGAWSSPYTKNMDIMVVSVLEQDLICETAQLLSKWCLDFGVFSPKVYELLRARYNEHYKEQCLQELKNNNIIYEGEDRILNDFIYDLKRLQNQLAGTLERMKKADIIEYYPVPKGFIEDGKKTINLHESTVKKILTLQRELMEHYNVDEWYLNTYYNARKSREYRKVWKERLAQITSESGEVIGLSYWYNTYAIILKARKKKIIHYLEKFNKEVIQQFKENEQLFLNENKFTFQNNRHDYVVSEAQKKEDKFLDEKTRIIYLNESVREIYDSSTREEKYFNQSHEFTYDENYYALYFDRLYAKRITELQKYYGHTFK